MDKATQDKGARVAELFDTTGFNAWLRKVHGKLTLTCGDADRAKHLMHGGRQGLRKLFKLGKSPGQGATWVWADTEDQYRRQPKAGARAKIKASATLTVLEPGEGIAGVMGGKPKAKPKARARKRKARKGKGCCD